MTVSTSGTAALQRRAYGALHHGEQPVRRSMITAFTAAMIFPIAQRGTCYCLPSGSLSVKDAQQWPGRR